jgi:hypothetical protein
MAVSRLVVKQKKPRMGRPPTGINPIMAFRPLPPLRAEIEAYAEESGVSISEAMRQLIEAGLSRKRGSG